MPVSVICPQLSDATARSRLHTAVEAAIKRWRPGFDPRFRKTITLYGPMEDLPGLVTAYVDAVLANG